MQRAFLFSILLLSMPMAAAPLAVPAPPSPAGTWGGALLYEREASEVDLLVSLSTKPEGGWTGALSVPMMGMQERPLSDVAVDGLKVSFVYKDEQGTRAFQGRLSEDGQRITGEYRRGEQTVPFELVRRGSASLRIPSVGELIKLPPDAKDLKSLFDKDKDKVRLLMLLSPTCSTCQVSARMIQRYVLDAIADERLRVYVVWAPIDEGDDEESARMDTRLISDPRATHFWAGNLALPQAYKGLLGTKNSVAYDVFLIFPPGALWQEPAPLPPSFMHFRLDLPASRKLNGPALTKEMQEILKAQK